MSYTQLALLGFVSGVGMACAILSLLSGYFAARRALAEV